MRTMNQLCVFTDVQIRSSHFNFRSNVEYLDTQFPGRGGVLQPGGSMFSITSPLSCKDRTFDSQKFSSLHDALRPVHGERGRHKQVIRAHRIRHYKFYLLAVIVVIAVAVVMFRRNFACLCHHENFAAQVSMIRQLQSK